MCSARFHTLLTHRSLAEALWGTAVRGAQQCASAPPALRGREAGGRRGAPAGAESAARPRGRRGGGEPRPARPGPGPEPGRPSRYRRSPGPPCAPSRGNRALGKRSRGRFPGSPGKGDRFWEQNALETQQFVLRGCSG